MSANILDDLVLPETLVVQVIKTWAGNHRSLYVVLAGYIVLRYFSCFDFMNIRIVGVFHAAHRLGLESLAVGCQFFDAFTIRLLGL